MQARQEIANRGKARQITSHNVSRDNCEESRQRGKDSVNLDIVGYPATSSQEIAGYLRLPKRINPETKQNEDCLKPDELLNF